MAPSPRPQVSGHPCPLHSTCGVLGTPRPAVRSRAAPRTSGRGAASSPAGPWLAARRGSRSSSRSGRSRTASRGRSRGDTRCGRIGSDERRARTSARKLDAEASTCETVVVARVHAVTEGSEVRTPGLPCFRSPKSRSRRLSRANSRQPVPRAHARNCAFSDARRHESS